LLVFQSNIYIILKKFTNGSDYKERNTFCESTFCKTTLSIIVVIAIILIGIALLIKGCCTSSTGTTAAPVPENTTLINLDQQNANEQKVNDVTLFQSGIWLARYLQYDEWHGPHQFSLVFDHQSMKVRGSGSDDIGIFKIRGIYSNKTNEISLTKRYQPNTDDPSENFEHTVSIELTWNEDSEQFEGKWYVETSEYHGQNAFELIFDRLP
jgi:hypothetical protein